MPHGCGGRVPPSARLPETTVNVPVGATRDVEWVADEPGDWIFPCHKADHTMSAMSHDLPNMIGVDQPSVEEKVRAVLPGSFLVSVTADAQSFPCLHTS